MTFKINNKDYTHLNFAGLLQALSELPHPNMSSDAGAVTEDSAVTFDENEAVFHRLNSSNLHNQTKLHLATTDLHTCVTAFIFNEDNECYALHMGSNAAINWQQVFSHFNKKDDLKVILIGAFSKEPHSIISRDNIENLLSSLYNYTKNNQQVNVDIQRHYLADRNNITPKQASIATTLYLAKNLSKISKYFFNKPITEFVTLDFRDNSNNYTRILNSLTQAELNESIILFDMLNLEENAFDTFLKDNLKFNNKTNLFSDETSFKRAVTCIFSKHSLQFVKVLSVKVSDNVPYMHAVAFNIQTKTIHLSLVQPSFKRKKQAAASLILNPRNKNNQYNLVQVFNGTSIAQTSSVVYNINLIDVAKASLHKIEQLKTDIAKVSLTDNCDVTAPHLVRIKEIIKSFGFNINFRTDRVSLFKADVMTVATKIIDVLEYAQENIFYDYDKIVEYQSTAFCLNQISGYKFKAKLRSRTDFQVDAVLDVKSTNIQMIKEKLEKYNIEFKLVKIPYNSQEVTHLIIENINTSSIAENIRQAYLNDKDAKMTENPCLNRLMSKLSLS